MIKILQLFKTISLRISCLLGVFFFSLFDKQNSWNSVFFTFWASHTTFHLLFILLTPWIVMIYFELLASAAFLGYRLLQTCIDSNFIKIHVEFLQVYLLEIRIFSFPILIFPSLQFWYQKNAAWMWKYHFLINFLE